MSPKTVDILQDMPEISTVVAYDVVNTAYMYMLHYIYGISKIASLQVANYFCYGLVYDAALVCVVQT